MKRLMILTVLVGGAPLARAEMAEAVLVMGDETEKVFLTAASTANVEYTVVKGGPSRTRKSLATIDSIYFFEPPLFKEALHLYESRDYQGAREKFAACKEAYESIDNLPGNYSTLAAFYELECCRKLREFDALKELLDSYQSGPMTRETFKRQERLYPVWDAVRTKSWARLDSLAGELLADKEWTGEQLAQIYFCRGLALEALERPTDALNAYNGAFTADYAASEEITREAALNCLRIYKNHEEVQLAIKLWGTEDEDPASTGYLMLQEAVSLCELWGKVLGGGKALPAAYGEFLKYKTAGAGPVSPPEPASKEGGAGEEAGEG